MRLQIAKVLPALALSLVMAEAGAALMSSAAAATTLPAVGATDLAAAGRYESGWPSPIVALQFQYGLLPGGSAVGALLPAVQIQAAPPPGTAKTSALLLSSLGMIGVISLLRLGRAP